MLKPEKLERNDTVAIVAPSQAAREETVNRAIKTIQVLGLKPVVYRSCYLIEDNFNVPDKSRAEDINKAFGDPSIKGIISLKAASGTLSLLSLIDYKMIKSNPKIFMGFSDITGVHLALNKLCNLVTFHGPLATSSILVKDKNSLEIDAYTYKYLYKNLFTDKPLGIIENPPGEQLECLCPGTARGKIIGGNLTLLSQTIDTKYDVDAKDKILFIEDWGESLENISSMLKKLAKTHKFEECAGIILGTWVKCGEEYANTRERELRLRAVFNEMLVPYGKPVLSNLRGGHNVPMITLPFGVDVELDAEKKEINFVESANRET